MKRRWNFVLAAAAPAAACTGQSAEYLSPSDFAVRTGERVELALRAAAEDGTTTPAAWPQAIDRFFIRVAGIQDNRDAPPPPVARGRVPALALEHPGVTMLVLDWNPVVLDLSPAEFREFLARAVPKVDPAGVPDGPSVRVRHVRSAKCLLHVAAAGEQPPDGATGTSKSSQLAEIRAAFDPVSTPVGADLPVRIYVRGDSEAGLLVRAAHDATGEVQEFISNAKGIGDFTITAPGPWRVEFHWARPLRGDPEAEWEVFSGTLTFSAPPAAASPGPEGKR